MKSAKSVNGKIVQDDGTLPIKPFVQLSDLEAPPPREWIVDDLIPEGAVSIWFGPGGSHKSRLAVDLGIALLTGQNFLNRKTKKLGRVLMIDGELDQAECARRAFGIVRGFGDTDIPAGFYYYQLTKGLDRPSLIERIERLEPDIIILDSFAAASMAKDMNKAEDVVGLIKQFHSLGASSCLVVDHTGKASKGDTPFGSIFKYNFARSLVSFELKGMGATAQSLRLRHVKSNFGRLLGEIAVKVAFDGNCVSIEPQGEWQHVQKAGKSENKVAKTAAILTKLKAEAQGVSVAALAELVSLSKHTVQSHISELRKEGHNILYTEGKYLYLGDLS